MKHSAAYDAYQAASAGLSGIVRQAAYAGFAVVWLLRADAPVLSAALWWALTFLGCALFADLLQAAWRSLVTGWFARAGEKRACREGDGSDDPEIGLLPPAWNWPTVGLFWGKVALGVAGYSALASEFFGRV